MKWTERSAWRKNPLYMLICLGLVILPVSNAVGQVPLYLASVGWLVAACRGRAPVNRRTSVFLGGFALIVFASLLYAAHPEQGMHKVNRFLIFPLAGAVTAAALKGTEPERRVFSIGMSLMAGVCLLGVYDLIRFPLEIRGGTAFEDVGNMTSPQFYLVGLMLLLGLRAYRPERLGRWFWICLPLITTGLLLHQKRGVWLATAATVGLWTLWSRRWKTLAVLGVAGCLALTLPFVQARLHRLQEVIQPTHGGRMILWTQVAPRILPEYPWGMGFNGSTYEDFREVLPDDYHMEVGLRHLHNNFLQIRLELGWHGVVWWTLWMAAVLWIAFRPGAPGEEPLLRGAVAFAVLGLLINGLVEYNFGDSEVQKMYLVLFGLLDVFAMRRSASSSAGD